MGGRVAGVLTVFYFAWRLFCSFMYRVAFFFALFCCLRAYADACKVFFRSFIQTDHDRLVLRGRGEPLVKVGFSAGYNSTTQRCGRAWRRTWRRWRQSGVGIGCQAAGRRSGGGATRVVTAVGTASGGVGRGEDRRLNPVHVPNSWSAVFNAPAGVRRLIFVQGDGGGDEGGGAGKGGREDAVGGQRLRGVRQPLHV